MDLIAEHRLDQPAAEEPAHLRPVVTLLVTAALTLLIWPVSTLAPVPSLDASWQAGLHMAANRGLPFGTHIDFTLGPWGFLNNPQLYFTSTGLPALLYTVAVQAAFIGVIFHVTARRSGYAWATALTFATATVALIEPSEIVPMIAFVLLVSGLSPTVSDRTRIVAALAGTAVAAFQLLVKFNTGAVIFAMAVILAATLPRRRLRVLAAQLIAMPLLVLLLWVAAGEPVSALPDWVRASIELTTGYTSAMALELGSRWIEYPIAFVILGWLLVFTAREARGRPIATKLGLLGLGAVFMFSEWKHAFVRHDAHAAFFFLSCAVFALVLASVARARRVLLVTCSVAVIVVAFSLGPGLNEHILRFGDSLHSIRQLVDGDIATRSRRESKAVFRIDGRTLSLLKDRPVHVDPYTAFIAWAYKLDWRPVPVFQSYSAFTPYLDRLNADALVGPLGPERILRIRLRFGIDRRNLMFESPAYTLALLCNFRELAATERYEVLARTMDRCGRTRRLSGELDATAQVAVPRARPGELVFMRITIAPSATDRLRALLHKPASHPRITIRRPGGATWYQLVEATAHGPLVLCVPSSAGYNAHFFDVTCPSTIRVSRRAAATVSFYAVPIRPGSAGATATP